MEPNKNTDVSDDLKKDDCAELLQPEYKSWVVDLKSRIRQSQIKAAVKVNTELLKLYWHLGSEIVEKQKKSH